MKKYIIISLLVLGISSCSYKEDNPLGQGGGASQLTEQLESYKKMLEEDNSYWLLSIFPGVDKSFQGLPRTNQGMGGYSYVLRFKDGQLFASSPDLTNSNDEQQTYFSYEITEAPELNFATYGSLIHHFYTASSNFPRAKGGDVEYYFRNLENGVFTLEGKHSGNTMTLQKLTSDRETFLNKVRENAALLQGKGLNPVEIGGATVELTLYAGDRQLFFSYGDTKVQAPYIVTERGIRFYQPVTVNGVTIGELIINEDKTALTTPDNTISIGFVNCPIVVKYLTFDENNYYEVGGGSTMWFLQNYVSQDLLDKFQQENESVGYGYRMRDLSMDFGFIPGNESPYTVGVHKFITNNLDGDITWGVPIFYELDIMGVGGHPDQVMFVLRGPAYNEFFNRGYYYANNNNVLYFPQPLNLCNYIADKGPYRVEDATVFVENDFYRLTSTKDDSTWFLLRK